MSLRKRSLEELRQKLFSGNWRMREWTFLQEQFGDRELFDTLLSVFSDPDPPSGRFRDQSFAGYILITLNPACPMELELVMRQALPNWCRSVEELPFHLANQFGNEPVLTIVGKLGSEWVGQKTLLAKLSSCRFFLSAWPGCLAPSHRKGKALES